MKHENYSIGYDVLKVHARLLHRFIHRNITVRGLENIPENTPIIFAPNHENALMDAMAVLLAAPLQPTWLARADIFGNPVVNKILYFLKISPVYRIRDGKDSLAKNDEVFDLSIRVLKNNKSLALFPEAMHNFKRQTIAHKKAVPRIAFMAEESEDFSLGIQIIPVGLYYSHYYNFNRELIVNFGKPIAVADFKEQYLENKNAAMMALRSEIHEKLVPLTLNIESKKHYNEYETLLEISNNNSGRFKNSLSKLEAGQIRVAKIESWENDNPDGADELLGTTKKYQGSIDELKVSDKTFSQKPGIFKAILMGFISILSSPLFLYGWINYFISFWLPSLIVRKKMRDVSFWATFEFVLWIILIPVFTLLQTALVWIFTKEWWIALAYLITLPMFGKLSMYLRDFYKSTLHSFRFIKNKKAVKSAEALRVRISATLKEIF
jgi:1-acyl-sn-glycerol-3-phosphate acyltransferase